MLSIALEVYQSLDDGSEVRAVFPDISNFLEKVWYLGLLYKLKQNAITDNLLNILKDFEAIDTKSCRGWPVFNMC